MNHFLALFVALIVSMLLVPPMMRLAPRLGMVDQPAERKVHRQAVPRAGGLGIVLGTLAPLAFMLTPDTLLGCYLFGALVLLGFGLWDDARDLDHYTKFAGQLLAVIPLVYYGDLRITQFPLLGMGDIPAWIAAPFTVFALVGMINALNHSDGLDGLAGGLSILSLAAIAYLAYLADGGQTTTIALATLGGVLGFLRYHTHPARVFMGDGGSQFLGFTLGFLVVALTQRDDPALSPALTVLLLGLPLFDVITVLAQRMRRHLNWFRATKNHFHHRLLELGFNHHEAVVIIYVIQTLFVTSAVLMPYAPDGLILTLYLGVGGTLFACLVIARRHRWRAHAHVLPVRFSRLVDYFTTDERARLRPIQMLSLTLTALFAAVALSAAPIPGDMAIGAAVLAILAVIMLAASPRTDSLAIRALSYITAAFVVYLQIFAVPNGTWLSGGIELLYVFLIASAAISIRYSLGDEFRTTPTDYLVILVVIAAVVLLQAGKISTAFAMLAIKLIIAFYCCEAIHARLRHGWNVLPYAAVTTLIIVALRGLL